MLIVVLFGLVVFALSNRIYVGRLLLISFELPKAFEGAVLQFRSTGRFVWPAAYALLFFAVATVARRHPRFGPMAVAIAAVVQAIDVSPFLRNARRHSDGPDGTLLDWSAWKEPLDRHRALVLEPVYDCAMMLRNGYESTAALHEISFMEAMRGMEVNTIPSPRTRIVCSEETAKREAIEVRPDTLYVLMHRVTTGRALANVERQEARCLPFNGGYACSTKLDVELAFHPLPYVLGAKLGFGRNGTTQRIEGPGWGLPEEGSAELGNVFEGARSTLHFVSPKSASSYRLTLEHEAIEGKDPVDLVVEANEERIGSFSLEPGQTRTEIVLPGSLPSADRYIAIDLQLGEGSQRVMARAVTLDAEE